jgi:hypothetical protein
MDALSTSKMKGGTKPRLSSLSSNSHYETDFGVSSAKGAGNTKIGFLKVRRRRTFKKPIFIMRVTG